MPDLNGDGCTDIAYTKNSAWRYRISNCATVGPEYIGPVTGSLSQLQATALDWDADGYDDIVAVDASTLEVKFLRSTGEALSAPVGSGLTNPNIVLQTGDANGDGLQDLLYRDSSLVWTYRLHVGVAPDLLDAVTDGFGVTQNFDYGVLTDPTFHTKYSTAVFPVIDIQPTRWAVKRRCHSTTLSTWGCTVNPQKVRRSASYWPSNVPA